MILPCDLLVGYDGIAVGWEAGSSHDFPAVSWWSRLRCRSSSWMLAHNCESRVFLKIAFFTAYAIHHDPVIGRKRSVSYKGACEDSSSSIFQRHVFLPEIRDSGQRDFFCSLGSDERIHERHHFTVNG